MNHFTYLNRMMIAKTILFIYLFVISHTTLRRRNNFTIFKVHVLQPASIWEKIQIKTLYVHLKNIYV